LFDDLTRPAKRIQNQRETGKGGVQDRCVTHASGQGWLARKFHAPMRNGGTDYIFGKAGRVIFVCWVCCCCSQPGLPAGVCTAITSCAVIAGSCWI
jgi:hypothetical protein